MGNPQASRFLFLAIEEVVHTWAVPPFSRHGLPLSRVFFSPWARTVRENQKAVIFSFFLSETQPNLRDDVGPFFSSIGASAGFLKKRRWQSEPSPFFPDV